MELKQCTTVEMTGLDSVLPYNEIAMSNHNHRHDLKHILLNPSQQGVELYITVLYVL